MGRIFISRTRCSQGDPLAEAGAHLRLASLTSVFIGHTMPPSASPPLPAALVAGTPTHFTVEQAGPSAPEAFLSPVTLSAWWGQWGRLNTPKRQAGLGWSVPG